VGAELLHAATASPAFAQGKRAFKASLDGYQQAPSFYSNGSGDFRLNLSAGEDFADYELSWADLDGSVVLNAHLHLGRSGTNGGTIAFLCSSSPPKPGVPLCPDGVTGSVVGTLDASRVIGPLGQGIHPGEFEKVVDALRAGATYVNIHTDHFTPGEIRGNIDGQGAEGH
jgi:hypothetical protein